jgi:hypothetical protein
MKVKELSFGAINIDGKEYFKDIVIHKGKIEKRKKIMKEVKKKAKKKGVKLVLMSTPDAIQYINEKDTNLILHLTC